MVGNRNPTTASSIPIKSIIIFQFPVVETGETKFKNFEVTQVNSFLGHRKVRYQHTYLLRINFYLKEYLSTLVLDLLTRVINVEEDKGPKINKNRPIFCKLIGCSKNFNQSECSKPAFGPRNMGYCARAIKLSILKTQVVLCWPLEILFIFVANTTTLLPIHVWQKQNFMCTASRYHTCKDTW